MACKSCPCQRDYESYREKGVTRRFILWMGGILGALAGGGSLWAFIRALIPNVLYEPSKKVKVGKVDTLPEGVSFHKEAKAFVIKEFKEGKVRLHAISAVCTHLGCIVQHTPGKKYKGQEVGFSCACHGSMYRPDGEVVKGPAPKALPWLALDIAPEDQKLVVDRGRPVKKGTYLTV